MKNPIPREFKLKFGKRFHKVRAFLNENNKITVPKKAVKVETREGEIFPIEYVGQYRP